MLVLSRKAGESIVIDGGIEVKVVEIRNGRVRLGFSAPPDVNIRREELRPNCVAQPETWSRDEMLAELCVQG